MKKFLTIVMTVIILVAAITSSTVTFAASMPTTHKITQKVNM